MKFARLILGASAVLVAAACGGVQPANNPASQEHAPRVAASDAPAPSGVGQPLPYPTAPSTPSTGAVAPIAPGTPTPRTRLVKEIVELQKGFDLAMTAGMRQCELACRALTSMEKAVEKLCQMAQGELEQQQCEDARARLRAAETRVKQECGECAR